MAYFSCVSSSSTPSGTQQAEPADGIYGEVGWPRGKEGRAMACLRCGTGPGCFSAVRRTEPTEGIP